MKLFSGIIFSVILFFNFQNKKESIVRMDLPTLSGDIQNIAATFVDFNDTLQNDTLFIHYNADTIPVKYSRHLTTSVCIEGKCRLVKIELFWNITGRYLGFELPNGEFLSKTEHNPFNAEEYDRLHKLLGDPISALANYSIKELIPAIDSSVPGVDAVSSATLTAVLDYIVEGAVYTTYTLWHIVHGETKREIEKLTAKKLNSELILRILKTNNLKDQVWVLNHFPNKIIYSPELIQKLMELISGDDVYLAERSLNALKPNTLTDEIQLQLATVFKQSGFLQKRLISQKLKEAEKLNSEVTFQLAKELATLNGSLVKSTLNLFTHHNIKLNGIIDKVIPLLKNENRFIANQAYQFLNGIELLDKKTLKEVEKYKTKML